MVFWKGGIKKLKFRYIYIQRKFHPAYFGVVPALCNFPGDSGRGAVFESDCEKPAAVDTFIHGSLAGAGLSIAMAKTSPGKDLCSLSASLSKALSSHSCF
jgi:hypothetical protein